MAEPWQSHPKLQGRFHPDAPSDVQLVVHDGGPRMSDHAPEAVWVAVIGCSDDDVFTGRVLNKPLHLTTVDEGSEITFVVPSGKHLLMVTDKYLRERENWVIEPCRQCGLDELFDAPSDLIRMIFPDLQEGETVEAFTSFCGICGGIQVVADKSGELGHRSRTETEKKKFWQFWR